MSTNQTSEATDSSPLHRFIVNVNEKFETVFGRVGVWIAGRPWTVLIGTLIFCSILTAGLTMVKQENDIYELWIKRDSRLRDERAFVEEYFGQIRSRYC